MPTPDPGSPSTGRTVAAGVHEDSNLHRVSYEYGGFLDVRGITLTSTNSTKSPFIYAVLASAGVIVEYDYAISQRVNRSVGFVHGVLTSSKPKSKR